MRFGSNSCPGIKFEAPKDGQIVDLDFKVSAGGYLDAVRYLECVV